jgi:enterochelin esterase-like enzyme
MTACRRGFCSRRMGQGGVRRCPIDPVARDAAVPPAWRSTSLLAVLVAACLVPGGAIGQSKVARLQAVIAEIEAGRRTTPVVGEPTAGGGLTVTFLARRGAGPVPRIVSDVTGWGERPDDTFDFHAGTMARVGQTGWYFLEATVAPGARVEYLVAHGLRDFGPDPHNPRRTRLRGGGPASELVTPGYAPPREFEDPPPTAAGRIVKDTIDSRALGSREVIVYTPPGYPEVAEYPVAVFHGGLGVASDGEAPRVIDWLIARKAIEPLVAVFVDSWARDTDDASVTQARAFLTGELLSWVGARYRVSGDPARRAVLGISFGARDVLDAATTGDVYHRVGLLIPGRRMRPADIAAFVGRCSHPLRVAIVAGLYDGPNLATAQRARDVLRAAEQAVEYFEVPEGHNPTTWRNHLRDVLVSLFGAGREREERR